MPSRSLLTIASSLESTIAASRRASRCARSTRVRSRAIFDAPTTWPVASRIGETVREIGNDAAVFALSDRLEMVNGVAAADRRQHGVFFGLPVGRDDHANRPADHFVGPIAEQSFRRRVPRHDHAVQVLADDRVVAGFDQGGKVLRRGLKPAQFVELLSDVCGRGGLHHAAQELN